MQNAISIFQFQAEKSVRVEFKNGEPLFCLTDVANILEIRNANPLRFNLKDNGVHKMYSADSKGRKNEITFINEPNLYRVIFRSNKPEAVKFQDWIFEEVIPQIRKTGSYVLTITPSQQQQIQATVNKRVYRTGETHQAVYTKLHAFAKVGSYLDIPSAEFETVMQFLEAIHDSPMPIKQKGVILSDKEIYDIGNTMLHSLGMLQMMYIVFKPLYFLNSPYTIQVKELMYSCKSPYLNCLEIFEKMQETSNQKQTFSELNVKLKSAIKLSNLHLHNVEYN